MPHSPAVVRVSLVLLAFTLLAACSGGQVESGQSRDGAADTSASQSASPENSTAGNGQAAAGAPTTVPDSSVPPGPRGPRGSGQTVSFVFAGDSQFPDVLDTEPGSISSGVPLAEQLKKDPMHVLDPVTPTLSAADLTMVNLETAITERGEKSPIKNFHFRSPASSFTALKAAGIDVVNMANNHSLDFGPVGMQDTFDAIESSKFPVVGIGHNAAEAYRPYKTVIKGQRIAIFGALDNVEPAIIPTWAATDSRPGVAVSTERTRFLDGIKAARPDADTIIVFMHWGTEQTHCASPAQTELLGLMQAAGADVVVGSHEHREFAAGRRGGGFVAFGLGNFIYWREDDESGRTGILQLQATGRQVDSYAWVPARIKHGIPIPQTGAAAAADVAEWEKRRTCSGLAP